MIVYNEPKIFQDIMIYLNYFFNQNEYTKILIGYTADIFVFIYPIYLILVYLYGLYYYKKEYNIGAFYIFFSAVFSIIISIIIQFFVIKERPEQVIQNKEYLILEHLPTRPFPSDHASLSFAIAIAAYIYGKKYNIKFFIYSSYFFLVISIIMSFSRVVAAVHWPTDVLAGFIVGFISAYILYIQHNKMFYIYQPLYKLSKIIFRK